MKLDFQCKRCSKINQSYIEYQSELEKNNYFSILLILKYE